MERNFWNEMRRMRRKMNQFFSYPDFPEQEFSELEDYRKAFADFQENDEEFIVNVEIPGINKKDVNIEIVDGRLVIKAEKREELEKENEEGGEYFSSKSYAGFYRVVRLPEDTSNEIEASYSEGVLKIVIPKKKNLKKERKVVRVR